MHVDGSTVGSLGERAALARIIPRLPRATAATLGPGDDAAVLSAADGRVVLTTDVMVEGPDFRLAWSTPHNLGFKAAATNLADVAAMGARPTALLVALTVPADAPMGLLEGIADGFADACAALAPGCGVIGGDLTMSPTLTIAVTAVGSLEGWAPVRRDGARPGDQLAYAGRLGLAGAALQVLFAHPDDATLLRAERGPLLAEQLAPEPPIGAGRDAAMSGATAMLDVSDGLLLDAGRIAEASGVILDFDPAVLAADVNRVAAAAPELATEALRLVLTGGEDHGLLACFPPHTALPASFRLLGRVLAPALGGRPAVLLDGADPAAATPGWDSFTPS